MPQVDLESLVRVSCGDPKVACEPQPDPQPYADPDVPRAESFRVPIEVWLDINPVYERDDSTKGTTNPKSHHHHQQPQPPPPANSQRFSGNLKPTAKAPIIGLPNKIQHSGLLGQSARRPHRRIAPKKGLRLSDPGSPKVSCFGRVLSDRDRPPADPAGGGCWVRLFLCFGRREAAGQEDPRPEKAFQARDARVPPAAATATEPPGLGGMKRFVSGRRAASWGGDVVADLEEKEYGRVAWSGPLDRR